MGGNCMRWSLAGLGLVTVLAASAAFAQPAAPGAPGATDGTPTGPQAVTPAPNGGAAGGAIVTPKQFDAKQVEVQQVGQYDKGHRPSYVKFDDTAIAPAQIDAKQVDVKQVGQYGKGWRPSYVKLD